MKQRVLQLTVIGSLALTLNSSATTRYVDVNGTNAVPPYSDWNTAATNIQDAVDAANSDDQILVTNGLYNIGGRVVYGSLTNRVAINKAITVQSVNGPGKTAIAGGAQMRCVYVGSNAMLIGFTITNGYSVGVDVLKEQSGGGIWCETSGVVSNCLIRDNSAYSYGNEGRGGGVYGGTVYDSVLIGNSARYGGGGAASASLFNCLIASNNYSSGGSYAHGAGVYQGTLSNCTLTANGKISDTAGGVGGGAYQSRLFNCLLLTNYGLGGAVYSELHDCTLIGNQGGTYQCTNYNCTLRNNSGYSGGGMYGGISYNCLVVSNTAAHQGGGAFQGALYNCTVIGNMATNLGASGGGVYDSSLYNCIVYYNTAPTGSNWSGSTTMYNCYRSCTLPSPSQSINNITNAPSFVDPANGDFRLKCGSPGINAGGNFFVSTPDDLNGNPRIIDGTVDMGACEFDPVMDLVPKLRKNFNFDNFAAAYPVPFVSQIGGCPDYFWWDFGDGTTATNQTSVSHAWTAPGTYNVLLTAYSASLGHGLSATTQVSVVQQPVYYVNANSPTPAAPYNTWLTAAPTIQDGIRAGNTPGRLVLVTNGWYLSTIITVDGIFYTNVTMTNFVVVQSVNGPDTTTIGAGIGRGAYVGSNSILSGFTVTRGHVPSTGDIYRDQSGGGIWCDPLGVVSNCVISGNQAYYGGGAFQGIFYNCVFSNNASSSSGGGAYLGTFFNCLFVSNSSSGGGATYQSILYDSDVIGNRGLRGGGSFGSMLSNCVVMNNRSFNSDGGGSYLSTLYNCTVSSNSANNGGGAYASTLYNCTVRGNSSANNGGGGYSNTFWNCVLTGNNAIYYGGGAYASTLYGCLVVSNQASVTGGGLYSSTLYNCTVVKNTAHNSGGFYGNDNPSVIYNSIIFGNTASSGNGNNWGGRVMGYNSCSMPSILYFTSPNITNDPVFVDAAYHLSAASPCRGTGSPSYTTGTDMDAQGWKNPPSMGADEVYDTDFIGALSVAIQSPQTNLLVNRSLALTGQITGRAAGLEWSFGDGPGISNVSYFTSHSWTSPGDYTVAFTAYNTDNPSGVSTNLLIHVLALDPPLLQPASFSLSSTNGFQFQFNGQSDAIYTVQVATNLVPPVVWQNLQTITGTGGVVQVSNANSMTNAISFYRVGVQ